MKKSGTDGLQGIFADIPLAHAMRISVKEHADGRLVLGAPAAPCLNHIGIAFGGAIECLGTLAGWGLLWLALDDPELRIVIQHAETTFKAPLRGDLHAVAELPAPSEWDRFIGQLERRERARIDLRARIGDPGQPEGASFAGRYAVARSTAA